MLARIGVMRGLNRHVERVFGSSRKETHWGKLKLARDRWLRKSLLWLFSPALSCTLLAACASGGQTAGEHIADMPHWMGGLPEGTPPRRGTPEYDAWMKQCAEDAAAIKPTKDGTAK